MSDQVSVALIAALSAVVVAWIGYLGIKSTRSAAQNAPASAPGPEAALAGWQAAVAEFNDTVRKLRREQDQDRERRAEHDRAVDEELTRQREQIEQLRGEVATWQRVAKTIARWATALRDEVLRLGGTVPATPEELLTLQAIEDAEQS